jgi:short-subunit dehydrogenase
MRVSALHADSDPYIVLITGATGAIGQALADYYAADGVKLVLQGRNTVKLAQLTRHCQSKGADVSSISLDLTDSNRLLSWLDDVCSEGVPDLVIANAGMNIDNGLDNSGELPEKMEALLDLNVKSTLVMVNALAKKMLARGSGQIGIISSLAGYYGLPVTPSYSASKAAVKAYGEGIRGWLAPHGVGVTVVMPGYVDSAMCTAMVGPKPFLWSPEHAAKVIARGLASNRARISFPFPLNLGTWFLAVLPSGLSQFFLRLFNYSDGH